jgi:transcriptional regulator with XRE-family HTH domain
MGEQLLDRQSFGPHLRELRLARGLTIVVCAKHAGVTRDTWRKWETGSVPQIWRAPRIARALDISLSDLLAPDAERVHVAELTISVEVLKRIRKLGAPELERIAATLAREAMAKVELMARTASERKPPRAKPAPVTRPAWAVRRSIALRRLTLQAEREARELVRAGVRA